MTITPRTHIVTTAGYAAPSQSGNAVVSSVQSQLAKLGYYGGAVDGVLGDKPRLLSPAIKRTMT